MTEEPIDPSEMLERLKDPDYLARVRGDEEHRESRCPNVMAIIAGIRFIHDFAQMPEGKIAVKAALDAGFVELAQGDDGKLYIVPRFIWPDGVYDDLFPNHSLDVAVGVAVGRRLLWGDPEAFYRRPRTTSFHRAVVEAVRRFERQRE